MALDLSKLTPGKWFANEDGQVWSDVPDIHAFVCSCDELQSIKRGDGRTDAEFIALARNDLDVKQRRGWHTEKCTEADQWVVPQLLEFIYQNGGTPLFEAMYQQGHDVGLLTKADAWMTAQER